MSDGQEMVNLLGDVWSSITELCAGLSEDQWNAPTDVPGWTVKDNLSHIVGFERQLVGYPATKHEAPKFDYIRNALGESNERDVDLRRSHTGGQVYDEFRVITSMRLKALRDYADEDFNITVPTPLGESTLVDFLRIRVVDAWAHEQDIRRALDKPGALSNPSAKHSLNRFIGTLPYIVAKKAQAPNASMVVFEIDGWDEPLGVQVIGGRGELLDITIDPTVTISLDLKAFIALVNGRWDTERALAEGVKLDGDPELARRVLDNMNIMF